MNRPKFILSFLVIPLVLSLVSCEKEINRVSTHTDASGLVVGTYTGTLSFENDSYKDVTIILTEIEVDSVQAVLLNIQASTFDFNGAVGMDLSSNVNVAKANNGYVFSSGFSSTLRLNGRLLDNELSVKLPIQVRSTNKEVRFHTNGNDWEFIGTKTK
jgi:hypothetical protein